MKKVMLTLLCFVVFLALGIGALLAVGFVTVEQMMETFGDLGSPSSQTPQSSPGGGSPQPDPASRPADHKPPSGEGVPQEGNLPKDRVPDAGTRYQFSPSLYPYRAMLNQGEQAAYDQVYANAVELYDTLPLHTPIPTDSIGRVMCAIYYDHPELFWLETAYKYTYNAGDSVVAVTLLYNDTAANIDLHRERYNSVVDQVVREAGALPTRVEQEKYVHDFLLDNVEYVADSPLNQSAYSAVVYGQSVCAGYARAFQHMMLELGIPSYYCVGYAGEAHAWNIVKLDDGYYHVDVAWDDPLGNPSGRRYYNYFNITDAQISADHTRTDLALNLPSCNATAYSYEAVFGAEEPEAESGEDPSGALEAAGYNPQDAVTTLDDYYALCRRTLTERGEGEYTFTVLVSGKELLDDIVRLTESGEAIAQYAAAASGDLGLQGYTAGVSLRAQPLEGTYWELTQQVQFREQAVPESPAPSQPDPSEESRTEPEEHVPENLLEEGSSEESSPEPFSPPAQEDDSAA